MRALFNYGWKYSWAADIAKQGYGWKLEDEAKTEVLVWNVDYTMAVIHSCRYVDSAINK